MNYFALGCCLLLWPVHLLAVEPTLPVLASDDFEQGAGEWEFLDPSSWKVAEEEGARLLSQHREKSDYQPPHRSPTHVAILKGPIVSDLELTVRVRSTGRDVDHRDACLFFGYQDGAHFYYVHLGKVTDPHCNQIFIVNGADRIKITSQTTYGTPWDDAWHTVTIIRRVDDGAIEIYFDDMEQPVMTARDKTFAWGRVGVGSFDDTADWDDMVLRGVVPSPPADHLLPDTEASGISR